MTSTPTIAFSGLRPEDPSELRLFAVALGEREGDGAQPLPCGGVQLNLHPAAPPVPLELGEGRLSGRVQTAPCGPGFHALVCRLLEELRRRFSPDLRVEDTTGYFEQREEAKLGEAMVRWRVRTGRRIAALLAGGGGPVLLGLPDGAEPAGHTRRRVITALASYTLGEWRRATEEVEQGLHLERHFAWWSLDKDAWYWLNRGLAYLAVRRLPGRADDRRLVRGLDACARARELDGAIKLPHVQLAGACERLERHADAIAHLEAAARESPTNLDLRSWLARLYHREGRVEEAADELEEVANRCPHFAELSYEAGLWLNALEHFGRAEALLGRAVQLKPKRAKYQGELAVALAGLGRYEEALEAIERALEREPANAAGWANKAALLEALGRDGEAGAARAELMRLEGEPG